MFLDLLGSGFSFAATAADLPTEAKTFGAQVTAAINSFAKESVLGQSSKIIIAGESTFIRSLPGMDDIAALKGLIHLSPWPELYAVGRYYGIAGVELKIYTESERIAIDSTFTSCYNYIRSAKFLEGHQCLDTIFNFVESRTKNTNLFDVRQSYNLTEFLPMVQYYFSVADVVAKWKAPATKLFESQAAYIANKTYVDMAKNYTKEISAFMKDYYSVRHWFVEGLSDYVSYYKGVRNWVENELAFVESDAFRKAKLEVPSSPRRTSSSTARPSATPRQSSRSPTPKSSVPATTSCTTPPRPSASSSRGGSTPSPPPCPPRTSPRTDLMASSLNYIIRKLQKMKARLEAIKEGNSSLYAHLVQLLRQIVLANDRDAYQLFEHYSHCLKHVPAPPPAPDHQQLADYAARFRALINKPNVGSEEEPAEPGPCGYLPNLLEEARLFEKAGVGFGEETTFIIFKALERFCITKQVKEVKFWGKVLGRERDYYVVEGTSEGG